MKYYLFYDPASYKAGASLFNENGELVSWSLITGKQGEPLAVRLRSQLSQLSMFVSKTVSFQDYLIAVIENIYGVASQRMELGSSAAVPLFLPQVVYHSSIPIQTWKKWLRDMGVPAQLTKGREALRRVAPEIDQKGLSDDVADSIIFGLYYFSKGKTNGEKSVQTPRRKRTGSKTPAKRNPATNRGKK
jgi:hypothetical protein